MRFGTIMNITIQFLFQQMIQLPWSVYTHDFNNMLPAVQQDTCQVPIYHMVIVIVDTLIAVKCVLNKP